MAEDTHLVRDWHRDAPAQARRGARERSRCGGKKGLIERAYMLGAQLGLSVWCADEAGPFQAVPHPGVSWQPREHPAQQPHEDIRGVRIRSGPPCRAWVRVRSIRVCWIDLDRAHVWTQGFLTHGGGEH